MEGAPYWIGQKSTTRNGRRTSAARDGQSALKNATFQMGHETHSPFQTRARANAGARRDPCRDGGGCSERFARAGERGREMCRYNFVFNGKWQGKHSSIKQVAPVIK
ncbi:MAG TPA: hypothetical protein DCK93_08940 [Blastocatellia bacterium]|nr:hypothetical protein [Blastocatellia bacterium]